MAMHFLIVGWHKPNRDLRVKTLEAAFFLLSAVIVCTSPIAVRAAGHAHQPSGESVTFGTIDFENSCTQSVQPEFRTAVAMLHSFAADAKQFVDVAIRDPYCAVAWWGAAMATRGNPLAAELDRDGVKVG